MLKELNVKQLFKKQRELRERQLAIQAEREEIEYNLPAKRLERLRAEEMLIIGELPSIDNELDNRLKALPQYAEVNAIGAQISVLRKREADIRHRALLHGVSVIEEFISENPEKTAPRMIEARNAQARMDELEKKQSKRPDHILPSRATIGEMNDLQNIVRMLPRYLKQCEYGREVFAVKEEIRALEAKRDE